MARSKKNQAEEPERDDITQGLDVPTPVAPPPEPAPTDEPLRGPLQAALSMENPEAPIELLIMLPPEGRPGLVAIDLALTVDDLIATCPTEIEWKLRRCAERFEAEAVRLRAEWLRRRGGQP